MKVTDIMIDIETLDITPTAIVVSIGAVAFNAVNPFRIDKEHLFYVELGNTLIDEQLAHGRTESEATRKFWDGLPKTASVTLKRNTFDTVDETLIAFKEFMKKFPKTNIWGCGPDFDCVILSGLLHEYGYKSWQFWRNRCFRTIKKEFGEICDEPQRYGTLHNALDDAKHQARWLTRIYGCLSHMSDLAQKAQKGEAHVTH